MLKAKQLYNHIFLKISRNRINFTFALRTFSPNLFLKIPLATFFQILSTAAGLLAASIINHLPPVTWHLE